MTFSKRGIRKALPKSTFLTAALIGFGFGVGCLVGGAVAIMVTPKSGRELRSSLRQRGRDLVSHRREQARIEQPAATS